MDEEFGQFEDRRRQRFLDVNVGDEIVVLARKGKEDSVIGRLADGRVILFSKEFTGQINPGDTATCEIVHITGRYIIVMPNKVLGDSMEAMILNLKNVAESGYYQHAVLAKALIYLIERNI